MALVVNLSRRRAVEQLLGVVPRSIGYLQGGYKGSTIQSKVQLFNTITQTGRIVYDTGYQLSIRAAMFRWVAVNAYVPDVERMGLVSPERVTELQQRLESLNTDDEIKQFTVNNLYYDL